MTKYLFYFHNTVNIQKSMQQRFTYGLLTYVLQSDMQVVCQVTEWPRTNAILIKNCIYLVIQYRKSMSNLQNYNYSPLSINPGFLFTSGQHNNWTF